DGYVRADEAHVLRWDVLTEGGRISRFVVEVGESPEELTIWQSFSADSREAVREKPPVGSSFYRLRVQMEDGSEIHSSVLELRRAAPEAGLKQLEAFPNPTTGELTVRFVVSSAEPVSLSIWNALGQVVIERSVEPSEKGWVETQLHLGELPAGPVPSAGDAGG
ncbi:MAG: T9SS type A sorting domain-containing protein, partial [Bacteroidia bacterium]|nr:T9SS type A sorting domain-containing protein [Bacteroidia bacterium]